MAGAAKRGNVPSVPSAPFEPPAAPVYFRAIASRCLRRSRSTSALPPIESL